MNTLPLLIEPKHLEERLHDESLIIVDLCKPDNYIQAHIPGALYLDYKQIIAVKPPVMGLLPSVEGLENLTAQIGLTDDKAVVVYDDEGGGKAARFLWTLHAIGFHNCSLLNGGIHAWANENHTLEKSVVQATPSQYKVTINSDPIADKSYILQNLETESVALLDARSEQEYRGLKKFAEKAGHIPGAINIDWMLFIDQNNNARLKPEAELRKILEQQGLTQDKTIVTYCQSHHRSALSYWVLKLLGYTDAKGYPGSWSDWGNSPETPVST